MSRVARVAVPVLVGVGSVRVYAVTEEKSAKLLSPQQLSIYSTQESRLTSEAEPGAVQRGLAAVREGLQPYVQKIKNGVLSVKVSAVNLYHGAEDVYHFLKDPPPGFVPRVALIGVGGLSGVVLARKGSRLKRLLLPLGSLGAAVGVCYPVQSITALKVSGVKVYAASQWTGAAVASLWRSSTRTTEPSYSESESGSEQGHTEVTESSTLDSIVPEVPQSEVGSTPEGHVLTSEEPVTPPEFYVINTEGNPSDPNRAATRPVLLSEALQTQPEMGERGADKPLMDFGQSNPEDSDLYSTRS